MPSVFDIKAGDPRHERYAVPGTLYTLERVNGNRYVPIINGVVDAELSKQIDDRFHGEFVTSALMHEVGKLVQLRAESE